MSTRVTTWTAAIVGALLACPGWAADEGGTPFKLGTFRAGGRAFLGLVLQDTRVVDIAAANATFEREHRQASKVRPPADMQELI
jgi:hypothetical protein